MPYLFGRSCSRGGTAPNTATCYVLITFRLQRIGHANLGIGRAELCIGQNASLPHPAQAKSEKSRPSASGAGKPKAGKAGPAPMGAREKYANAIPFRMLLLNRVAQHQTLLFYPFEPHLGASAPDMQICASDVRSYASDKTHPSPVRRRGQKREEPAQRLRRSLKAGRAGPVPVGAIEKYTNAIPFRTPLLKKGWPSTKQCYLQRFAKIWVQRIGHASIPPPPGAGQKREKPAQR
jgi:hypothetical protein